jgi:hypothetical protein
MWAHAADTAIERNSSNRMASRSAKLRPLQQKWTINRMLEGSTLYDGFKALPFGLFHFPEPEICPADHSRAKESYQLPAAGSTIVHRREAAPVDMLASTAPRANSDCSSSIVLDSSATTAIGHSKTRCHATLCENAKWCYIVHISLVSGRNCFCSGFAHNPEVVGSNPAPAIFTKLLNTMHL